MNSFHNPPSIARSAALAAFDRGEPNAICDALVAVALHDPDWRWVQSMCLKFIQHKNPDVRGVAVTCLGHVARIHGKLDVEIVVPILQELRHDPEVGGRASDALDDIGMYLGKR